jgi:hypothetical protein
MIGGLFNEKFMGEHLKASSFFDVVYVHVCASFSPCFGNHDHVIILYVVIPFE